MRFMIILRGNKEIEGGALPTEDDLNRMNEFNEELVNAGVMVGGEGLHPASDGVRVTFKNGKATVTEGASPGVLVGFWLWKVDSMNEAIDWVKRIPGADGEIEIRQIFETEEFSDIMSPEAMEQEERLRQKIAEQNAKAASAK
jgi:hypothetical protein